MSEIVCVCVCERNRNGVQLSNIVRCADNQRTIERTRSIRERKRETRTYLIESTMIIILDTTSLRSERTITSFSPSFFILFTDDLTQQRNKREMSFCRKSHSNS